MKRNFRKPLVIFTPKSLLRHKLAVSSLDDMAEGSAFRFVIPEIDAIAPPEQVRRVVLCSGKVYYDLLTERRDRTINDVAIMRLEQIYPFPEKTLARELAPYRNAELVWCQEEPENMGAWNFVDRRMEKVLAEIGGSGRRPVYVGRDAAASPATGSARAHNAQAGGTCRRRAGNCLSMATEINVPTLGESVTSATVARWMKHEGEAVAADEPLVELETDKVTVEVNAPAAGVLTSISAQEGSEVPVGALLGLLEAGAGAASVAPKAAPKPAPPPEPRPAAMPQAGVNPPPRALGPVARPATPPADVAAHAPLPAAAKLIEEQHLSADQIGDGTGKDGRITKGDVLAFLNRPAPAAAPIPAAKPPREAEPREERVRMTRLRRTIAARLKEAQNTAAMLTTFNEVDMSAVMALRSEYRDAFEKKHDGVRLGFMSFFVKACVAALKEFPAVNAEIDGDDIVYKNFVHMGIAVGGSAGLVVPVIRDVDAMSFAEIEGAIADFGRRARDGALKLDELTGGTFSITNGGVYGSLMSTPILNPPQSGILGMHKIQERPMVVGGQDRGPADDVSRAELRPSHRRRQGGGQLPGAGEGRRRGSPPVVVGALMLHERLLRCHRHRLRPRRLRLRHPRSTARHEGRLRREARDARRHLPQHRLHPIQGAAAVIRGIPSRSACAERPRRAGGRREA